MRSKTLQIKWTGTTTKNPVPINTLDFHPGSNILVTGAADKDLQLWRVLDDENGQPSVEHIQALEAGQRNINCVRWSPKGDTLASAGDHGELVFLKPVEETNENNEIVIRFRKELFPGGHNSDIHDLAWSPDASAFVTGSIDNSVLVWDASSKLVVKRFTQEHGHYVQGVSWDPRGTFLTSLSCDRTMRPYGPKPLTKKQQKEALKEREKEREQAAAAAAAAAMQEGPGASPATPAAAIAGGGASSSLCAASSKSLVPMAAVKSRRFPPEVMARHAPPPQAAPAQPPTEGGEGPTTATTEAAAGASGVGVATPATQQPPPGPPKRRGVPGSHVMFHDENEVSFFRRMGWSPDGSLLAVPSGIFRRDPTLTRLDLNVTYLFSRRGFDQPVAMLPALRTPTAVARFCPRLFRKNPDIQSVEGMAGLPYRMIVAAATQDSVLLYETQGLTCVATIGGLHLSTITDLAWSRDGLTLATSSRDGYCSIVRFEEGELGWPLDLEELPPHVRALQPDVRFAGQTVPDLTNFKPAVVASTGPFQAPQLAAIGAGVPPAAAAAGVGGGVQPAPVRVGGTGPNGEPRTRITPVPVAGVQRVGNDPSKKRIAPTPLGQAAAPVAAATTEAPGGKKRIAPTPVGAVAAAGGVDSPAKRQRTEAASPVPKSPVKQQGEAGGERPKEAPQSPLKALATAVGGAARAALALIKKPKAQ